MDNIFIKAMQIREWTPETHYKFIISEGLHEKPFPFFKMVHLCRMEIEPDDQGRTVFGDSSEGSLASLVQDDVDMLNEHRFFWVQFLRSCSIGKPKLDMVLLIKKIFFDFLKPEISFVQHTSDRWKIRPVFQFEYPQLINLTFYLELRGIIEPLFSNELEYYRRVRLCKHCRHCFIQSDARSKFCKDSCRYRWHDARRK